MSWSRLEPQRRALTAVDVSGRPLPSCPEIETGVVAAVLTAESPDAVLAQLGDLEPEHFADPSLATVFRSIRHLQTKGDKVRFRGIIDHLAETDRLGGVGDGERSGRAWLARLVDLTPAVADLSSDVRALLDAHTRRTKMAAAQRILAEGFAGQWSARDFNVWSSNEFAEASKELGRSSHFENLGEIGERRGRELLAMWAGQAEPAGLQLPWEALNGYTKGLGLGQVVFIGGLTGSGKTTLMLNAVRHVAGREHQREISGVGVLSLEMRREELYDKLVCIGGPMTDDELVSGRGFGRLGEDPFRAVAKLPIEIDDTEKTIHGIAAAARQADARIRSYGTDRPTRMHVLVVDHFDLVALDCKPEHIYTRKADLANSLKTLAKDLNICVVCLVQMTADASKQDRPPSFADIRGGSALYQIADKILLVDRPWCRKPDKSTDEAKAVKNQAVVIIAKHRQGKLGQVRMRFDGERSTFSEDVGGDESGPVENRNETHWND